MTDIGGIWRTVGGRRIFIKDGQDLSSAMKESGKFKEKEEKMDISKQLNNRKKLVDYILMQTNINLDDVATERQFAPRTGLNIDSRKLTKDELFTLKSIIIKKDMRIESNGVYDYFIYFEKKK